MRRYAIVTLTLAAASIFASDFVIEVPPRPWIPEHSRTLRRIEGIPHLDDFVQDVAEHGRDAMVDRLTASDPRVLKAVDAARQSVESGAADVVVIVLDNYSDGGVVRLDDVRSGAGTDVQSAVEQLLRNRNLKAGLPPSSAAEWQPRLYVTRVLNGGVVTFEPFTDVLGLLQRTYAAMRAAAERRNNELRAEAEAAQKRGKSRGGSNEGSGDGRLTERPWQSYERPDKPTDAKTSETKTDKPDPPSTDKRKEPKEPKNDTTTEPSEHPSIPMGGQRYVTGPPLTTAEAVLRGLDRDDPVTTRISIAQTLQEFAPWGLPGTRSWLDVDGDARPDFCRSTWAGWMEAPGQQWDAWDWVPPGALSWASYAGSISKAVNRRAYVQA